jgi:hypothetical protein
VAVVLILGGLVAIAIAVEKALTRQLDLYVILNASHNLLAGTDIYATPASSGAYYLYLPLIAFLFIPLALLPQAAAGVAWTVLCIALIALSLHESLKLIAGDAYRELLPFARWTLHLVPVIFCADAMSSEIGNAQVNCLILATAVLGLKLIRSRRESTAGAILGFAAVAKVFTAPLVIYELFQRRLRLIVGAAVGAIVALSLPATLAGWQRNIDYIGYWCKNIALHADVASHRSGFAGNASIQAVLTRLLTDEPAFAWNGVTYHLNLANSDPAVINTIGMLVPFLAILLLMVYFVLYRHRRPLVSYWGGIALSFCVAPLITPVVERPHFIMLLPAYVFVSYIWVHGRIENKVFYALLIAAFVLSTFTLKLYVGDLWGNVFWSLGAPTLADLCLIAAIFVAASRQTEDDLTATA